MTYEQAKQLVADHPHDWINHLPKDQAKPQAIKKDDLFYTSWGYDQTNYDYIIVTELSKTGKTVICKRAQYESIGSRCQSNEQKPIKKAYGLPFRMYVREYSGKPYLVGQYIFCGGEDSASKRYDSFLPVATGETFFETDAMFGH